MNCRAIILLFACCVLSGFSVPSFSLEEGGNIRDILEQTEHSSFVNLSWKGPSYEKAVDLGPLTGFRRYSACFRNKSCWMIPSIGNSVSELPGETQFLLLDYGNEEYVMLIPLVEGAFRSSLQGMPGNRLRMYVESGDVCQKTESSLSLYILKGTDPYEMIEIASKEISDRLQTFRLLKDKKIPWFSHYLGWCSWNAFYNDVTSAKVESQLVNMRDKHVPLQWILIDAGMQSFNDAKEMTSFEADSVKFPGGLKPFTQMVKEEYGIKQIFTWHTVWGYWKGVDPEVFGERMTPFVIPERYRAQFSKKGKSSDLEQEATVGPAYYPRTNIGETLNLPGPTLGDFYSKYYDYLRRQGIDGTKIDAMTWIECMGDNGGGGRVKMMRELLDGVQKASAINFGGDYINCSSCSNDYIFNAMTACVTRSSGDFFPEKPETHGFHVYTNAHTSFWMGEIVLPDWDMFQSGHVAGPFHAASRAISGGPVYTTEEVGSENADVLRALCTSNGRLLSCVRPARVAKSSLFTDPASNELAVNIYNENSCNKVIGTFNCSYDKNRKIDVRSVVPYSDICPESGTKYVCYDYIDGTLTQFSEGKPIEGTLPSLGFNLYTFAPVRNGFAVIGSIEKFNPGGAVTSVEEIPGGVAVKMIDGGALLAYSEKKPSKILCDGEDLDFNFGHRRLEVTVPEGKETTVYFIY